MNHVKHFYNVYKVTLSSSHTQLTVEVQWYWSVRMASSDRQYTFLKVAISLHSSPVLRMDCYRTGSWTRHSGHKEAKVRDSRVFFCFTFVHTQCIPTEII